MDIAEYKKTIVALRPTLIAVANRITRNTEDAEDVVQDVCLKIWHRRDEVVRYENVEAYCVTMTKNLSIDKIRTRRPVSDEDGFIGKTDNGRLPDELLEERDNKEAIRRIIMSLPPLQQRIFQLKDLEGYETEEIVEITGIAAEAVRNNLSRARKRLRELYLAYHRIKEKKA
ncbi:MAG: RNA polymerase sigma factor [Petrimonas sp.]|jgi:RNA polymerase sigma-70 factor (ECF subfamily)|uniref:RNA polymerase sigma factor n=1 Tax=Petrimonas sp. TaxID=2023866 RepID=UPI000E816C29|nr:RNA polymerase sigma factor [Petrimonas sp.]MEA4996449.1 RNA polymerase sigma factor [Petrimonas sp.]MEA5043594.1 RNA polymerase sigma factor [Petrimonas sp.]HBG80838.1 RNA polymerase subunit sigma-70 [Porphyromonadaceae bacterium]HMM16758.1 RNA polymerase sigma factor [Petrimonas sp.]